MATVAQLMVSIGADIAQLKSGLEESNRAVGNLKSSVDTHARGMQSSFEGSIAGIRSAWVKGMAVMYAAMQGFKLAKMSAEFEEQRGILDNLAAQYRTTADTIISSMKRASDGLISNADLMQIALAGIAKGLKPEQLINLADAARTLGDSVGKDATTALRDLSEALESGRTKALKGYLGTALDLDAVFGELASKMNAAEKAQAMYSLTMIQATKIQAQQKKEVSDAADKIEQLEAKYKNMTLTIGTWAKAVLTSAWDVARFASSAITDPLGTKEIARIGEEAKAVAAKNAARKAGVDIYQKEIDALKKILQSREDEKKSIKDSARDAEKAAKDKIRIEEEVIKSRIENEKRIGELSARILDYEIKQTENLISLREKINDATSQLFQSVITQGLAGTGIEGPMSNMMGLIEGKSKYDEAIKSIEDYYATVDNARQQDAALEALNQQKKVALVGSGFGTMASLANAFYAASNNQSKVAFRAYQAFAIAETVVATYQAAMASYAWGAKYGGPPLGAAMAAIATAAGLAKIAAIANTKIGSSAQSTMGGGSSTSNATASAASNVMNSESTQKAPVQSINIYVQGNLVNHEEFAREILPAILRAQEDRVS